jgi:hypothetical protein
MDASQISAVGNSGYWRSGCMMSSSIRSITHIICTKSSENLYYFSSGGWIHAQKHGYPLVLHDSACHFRLAVLVLFQQGSKSCLLRQMQGLQPIGLKIYLIKPIKRLFH